jgi:hypothetical protein
MKIHVLMIVSVCLLLLIGVGTAAETVSSALGTATVLTWDENEIIVDYNIDRAMCPQGCSLKILHNNYGYPICWFDFDISNKLKGTIETAPINARMNIKKYNWYVTIEPKEDINAFRLNSKRVKAAPIFTLTQDKMPGVVTKDPKYIKIK